MECGYYGWGRVIWKWGWEWGYSLLDCDVWCKYYATATGIELPREWVYLGGIGIWMWLMGWEWRDRQFCGRIGASAVIVSYSDLVLIGMGMRCGWFGMRNGVDFTRFGGNDHYFQFPRFWLDFHHFRCGSSLFPCSHSDNALSNAAEWALRWMGSGCCGLCVAQREESRASRWSVEVALKSSDVYSWERDEVSTSCDCDVILVVERIRKIHIGETGHV